MPPSVAESVTVGAVTYQPLLPFGAGGATVALTPVTAREGRFRPDFSGYSVPGRWSGVVRHSVSGPTRAMLEAWSTSAKDGSLECLVHVPVILRP